MVNAETTAVNTSGHDSANKLPKESPGNCRRCGIECVSDAFGMLACPNCQRKCGTYVEYRCDLPV